MTTLDFINGMNVSGLNKKDFTQLADNSALFGADLTKTLGDLISRQFRIAFPVEQSPDPNNRVTLSSVKDALNLPRPRDCLRYLGLYEAGYRRRISHEGVDLQQAGGDRLHQSRAKPILANSMSMASAVPLTYGGAGHIMGTYRMGNDPKTSVVDSWQCSHDHPNLYLVGSGTFPTVGTANPTLTLSALALRTAEGIIKEFKLHE